MIKLEDRRASLEKQLGEIQGRLQTLARAVLGDSGIALSGRSSSGTPAAASKPRARRASTRGARGSVTSEILKALKEAGSKGVSISDLAKKLNRNYANIYVWFSTTGKRKFPQIEKVGKACFRINE